MKPAILLIGPNGQVGSELKKMLPRAFELTSLDRQKLDLARPVEIREAVRAVHPAIIVNAAAYTNVDKAESEPDLARAINSEAPAVLAEEAKKTGACLVHYSTDYVFDGTKTEPYSENDPANPRNVYGKTKLEGERAIQASGAPHLIFRTAWVYATEGRNFLLTILRLATQREELKIVRDQTGAPTTSAEIARATTEILLRAVAPVNPHFSLANCSGIYHMTAAGKATWFEFAEQILEHARKVEANAAWFQAATGNLPLIARRILPIATSEFPTPARRPAYSVLSNELLARTFSVRLPDWQTQLSSIFSSPPRSDPFA
jgi:dTDP-4-dehydrorhamnose reductase